MNSIRPVTTTAGPERSVRDLVSVLAMLSVLFQILLGVVVAHAAQAAPDGLAIIEICSPSGPTTRALDGGDDPRPDPNRYPHCPACFLAGSHAIQAPDLGDIVPRHASGDPAVLWTRPLDPPRRVALWGSNHARAPPQIAET